MTTTPQQDVRRGLTSASKFNITYSCPGSENILRDMPVVAVEEKEPESEDATTGTRLHAAWETDNTDNLSSDDLEIYKAGVDYKAKAVREWCEFYGITEYKEGQRELRLWMHDPATMKPVTSGMTDWHFISTGASAGHILIGDFKSLWCRSLTPAYMNWQIRVLVALMAMEYEGTASFRGVLVKPIAKGNRTDCVDYTPTDAWRAKEDILQSIWKSKQPDAQRVPGNHCNWCPAKGICAEAQAWALLPSVIAARGAQFSILNRPIAINPELAKPAELVSRMSLADCALVHSRATVIGKILDEVKYRLKKVPQDQLAELGYTLVSGRVTPYIENASACFRELSDELRLPIAAVWKAVKFNKGETVEQFMLEFGWGKKQAEGYWSQMVEKYGGNKQSDPMLEKL